MRGVASIQRFVRWLFVVLPCRFHLSAEDRGSRPVWVYSAGWVVVGLVAAAAGAGVALVRGDALLDGLLVGAQLGLLLVLAWVTYAVAFLLVLWFRCVSPASVLNVSTPVGGGPSGRSRHGRAAADVGWRRPGEPFVTRGWLAGCLVLGLAALAFSWWTGGRFERVVPATASVVQWNGDAGAGRQWMELSYPAGGRTETTVLAVGTADGGTMPQPGSAVDVEYHADSPGEAELRGSTVTRSQAVPTWAERAAYLVLLVGLASGVVFLLQRRRPAAAA